MDPRIWPVKFAIPIAPPLLLLQGIATARDLRIARPESRAHEHRASQLPVLAVFVVILLTGLPLAFATGAVAVFFALVLSAGGGSR